MTTSQTRMVVIYSTVSHSVNLSVYLYAVSVTTCWWGDKRVDYCVHCPVALHDLPISVLTHVLHASYWESVDVIAFILQQVPQLTNTQLLIFWSVLFNQIRHLSFVNNNNEGRVQQQKMSLQVGAMCGKTD